MDKALVLEVEVDIPHDHVVEHKGWENKSHFSGTAVERDEKPSRVCPFGAVHSETRNRLQIPLELVASSIDLEGHDRRVVRNLLHVYWTPVYVGLVSLADNRVEGRLQIQVHDINRVRERNAVLESFPRTGIQRGRRFQEGRRVHKSGCESLQVRAFLERKGRQTYLED